ncbi:amino acid transporter, partial [Thozetella sp. PMI_491]
LGIFSTMNILIGKIIGVGIFSIPSSIYGSVGSVGMCLTLWCVGSIISFCGLKVYIDLGSALPYSGGEKVYLERIFRRPRMLSTCMFMAFAVTLGFSTPNCIVLGEYMLYATGYEPDRWGTRILGTAAVTLICFIHWRLPKLGVVIINIFGATKLVLLVFLFVSGIASTLIGSRAASIDIAQKNFSNIWAGTNTQPYALGTALLQILYCFRGYSAANQVLSEVQNPARVLNIASTTALLIVSMCYILTNVAYLLVVDLEDLRNSGVMTAGIFFRNIFGATLGQKVMSWLIIMSAFGNITATAYTQSHVNQEFGKEGILPFASWWRRESSNGAATQGLILHWIVTVMVIVIPPPGQLYNFLVSLGAYPVSVICTAITLGLIYLQLHPREAWQSPHPAKPIYTFSFAIANIFLIILPWIRPEEDRSHGSDFPYYAYPLTGVCILLSGSAYWIWW